MTFTYHNGISVAEIVAYTPCLLIAILLCIRHGFRRSAGFYFLIIFSLARILGGSMQLATISSPTSISLQTGSAILTGIGFSPLLLATLGLLSRLLDSINKSTKTLVTPLHMKLVETVITIALILGIAGGIEAGNNVSKPPYLFVPAKLTKVSIAIFIVCYAATVLAIIVTMFSLSAAEAGERRLFYSIAFALPFLAVRLVYSCLSTFTHAKQFSLLTGNATILLCVALIEEFIVTVNYEIVGLTLKKAATAPQGRQQVGSVDSRERARKENVALRIAKRTIIGRIVMALMPKKEGDVEMQTRRGDVAK
ncbi:hypothetical protein BJ875DRAFT_367896 [Amylocarpus encephaloides]|uniref:DUF7702 domain-containing protein n=1 Tax=Amylocarpus encephaloides TaxID=45428 RepID=A0A9P8C932_9HELO|nr:hypothetical protein BJ875DRAFT_367896 [Amylocarpus encephaloides]